MTTMGVKCSSLALPTTHELLDERVYQYDATQLFLSTSRKR